MHTKDMEAMLALVKSSWDTPELRVLLRDVDKRAIKESVLLPRDTLRALWYFEPRETKCVILGQDPYHKPNKANGLCFGLSEVFIEEQPEKIRYSSFGNVLAEVESSAGQRVNDFTLESWAEQGVLLLNTRLSVAPGQPMSHAGMGWEPVVRHLLWRVVLESLAPVFAWGGEARQLANSIFPHRRVLEASHPCKYSATRGGIPFVGCGHFAKVPDVRWGTPVRGAPIRSTKKRKETA